MKLHYYSKLNKLSLSVLAVCSYLVLVAAGSQAEFSIIETGQSKAYRSIIQPKLSMAESAYSRGDFRSCQVQLLGLFNEMQKLADDPKMQELALPPGGQPYDVEFWERHRKENNKSFELTEYRALLRAISRLADAYFLDGQYDKARLTYGQALMRIAIGNIQDHNFRLSTTVPSNTAVLSSFEIIRNRTGKLWYGSSEYLGTSPRDAVEDLINLALTYDLQKQFHLAEPFYKVTMPYFNYHNVGLKIYSDWDRDNPKSAFKYHRDWEEGYADNITGNTRPSGSRNREELLRMVYEKARAACGTSSSLVATRCDLLGRHYFNRKQYENAEKWYREAIAIRDRHPNEDTDLLCLDFEKLRLCFVAQHKNIERVSINKRLLELEEKTKGIENPEVKKFREQIEYETSYIHTKK